MARYWILSMSEDNYNIAKDRGLIGMSERSRPAIHKIAVEDLIIFYITKKHVDSPPNDPSERVRQFRGIAQVTGEPFESNDLIWHVREGELFPFRRKVEFLSDASTKVRPLIEKLSFVTNTMYWALPLRKGYVEITQKDLETIQAAMKVDQSNINRPT